MCIHLQGQALQGEKGPRRLLNRAERREAILRAAGSAFAGDGFARTTMDAVAARAEITRLIVYRHFASKEALYEAVLEQIATRLRVEFEARTGASTGPQSAGIVTGVVEAMMAAARDDPNGFTLLLRHAAREPQFAAFADAVRARAVETAETLLSLLEGDRARRRWEAEVIVSWLNESVLQWLEHGSPDRDAEAVAMIASALRAMVGAWHRPPAP